MSAVVTIGTLKFEIFKLPMLTRLKLDRKVASMILPIIAGLDGMDVDAVMDLIDDSKGSEEGDLAESVSFEKLSTALTRALMQLSDDDWTSLAKELLSIVSCTHPDHGATLLDSWGNIDKVFSDLAPMDVYRLAIEVMRENKFSPFALSGAGGGILGTVGSKLAAAKQKKAGLKLGRQAPSTP